MREILPGGIARTDQGDVRAGWVVRATEGYTASIRGRRRRLLPMNSSMIATEPLSAEALAAIGWDDAETIHDLANAYVYIQRTADDRIALGGRGVPYRYGSRTDRHGEIAPGTVASLERRLPAAVPAGRRGARRARLVGRARRAARLAVRRRRRPGAPASPGRAATSASAWRPRTSAAGSSPTSSAASSPTSSTLPFVGHAWRRDWEPEPLRYLGVTAMYALYRTADKREAADGPPVAAGRASRTRSPAASTDVPHLA